VPPLALEPRDVGTLHDGAQHHELRRAQEVGVPGKDASTIGR
jgi:hypothetical protein